MATTTFTPSMLRGAGTRGVPEIPAGSSYPYLLDIDGASDNIRGAWSLRKLSSTYTGDCCIIHSGSSGQYSTSIGFNSDNYIDTQSILDFVSPGNGTARVGTWYDQSGQGADLVQATNSNRMPIIASNNFYTSGSFIYLSEAGRQQMLASFTQINNGDPRTIFSVHNHESSNANKVWNLLRNAGVVNQYLTSNSNGEIQLYDRDSTPTKISGSAQFDLSSFNATTAIMQAGPDETAVYYKGAKIFSSTNRILGYAFRFQTPDSTSSTNNSDAVEYILYADAKTSIRAAIESNINNYYNLP